MEICPLRVNALLTGVTFFVGDGLAQWAERSSPSSPTSRLSAIRLGRAFVAGAVVLGPLTHVWYGWVSTQQFDFATKVALDNTVFLFLDNACYLLSLTLLGEGSVPLDDFAQNFCGKLWDMQLAGLRVIPLAAVINYLFVPSADRVLFMDAVDVCYAFLLSMLISREST